jgi:hypothetical protein
LLNLFIDIVIWTCYPVHCKPYSMSLMCQMLYRWTFRRQGRRTARTRSARSTPCTKSLNTRREKTASLPRESVVMTGSSQDMVVRPSLFSTRRYCNIVVVILYWSANTTYSVGFLWVAYHLSAISLWCAFPM